MIVIIAGSRKLGGKELKEALELCPWTKDIDKVVNGGAAGVDRASTSWAILNGRTVQIFNADWKMGKRAGGVRNQQMLDWVNPEDGRRAEALLAVWDGESRGTTDMIARAEKKGLRVYIHMVAPETRKPLTAYAIGVRG